MNCPSRRDFIKQMLVSPLIAGNFDKVNANTGEATNRKPNFLIINRDDLGIQLGCYGDKTARTPKIDSLASESTGFETAYVSQASCSPSRSSIYTGLFPHQNGQLGLSQCGYKMHKEYLTIPKFLKQLGYRTSVIGKYHIAPESACPWDFEYTVHTPGAGGRKNTVMAEKDYTNGDGSDIFVLDFETDKWQKIETNIYDQSILSGTAEVTRH